MVDPCSLRSLRWHGSDELPVGGNVIPIAARSKAGGVIEDLPISGASPAPTVDLEVGTEARFFRAKRIVRANWRYFFCPFGGIARPY